MGCNEIFDNSSLSYGLGMTNIEFPVLVGHIDNNHLNIKKFRTERSFTGLSNTVVPAAFSALVSPLANNYEKPDIVILTSLSSSDEIREIDNNILNLRSMSGGIDRQWILDFCQSYGDIPVCFTHINPRTFKLDGFSFTLASKILPNGEGLFERDKPSIATQILNIRNNKESSNMVYGSSALSGSIGVESGDSNLVNSNPKLQLNRLDYTYNENRTPINTEYPSSIPLNNLIDKVVGRVPSLKEINSSNGIVPIAVCVADSYCTNNGETYRNKFYRNTIQLFSSREMQASDTRLVSSSLNLLFNQLRTIENLCPDTVIIACPDMCFNDELTFDLDTEALIIELLQLLEVKSTITKPHIYVATFSPLENNTPVGQSIDNPTLTGRKVSNLYLVENTHNT